MSKHMYKRHVIYLSDTQLKTLMSLLSELWEEEQARELLRLISMQIDPLETEKDTL